jgi:hypothetical protein
MNVMLRGIDVRDPFIDRDIAVLGDTGRVAAGRVEAIDAPCEREGRFVRSFAEIADAVLVADGMGQAGINIATMLAAAAADPRLTEDQIGDDTQQRQRDDDDNPRQAGSRFAMGTEEDTNQDR